MDCKECGYELDPESEFCGTCGAPVVREKAAGIPEPKKNKYCAKCGEQLAEGVTFCQDCGAPVKGAKKPVEVQPVRMEVEAATKGPPEKPAAPEPGEPPRETIIIPPAAEPTPPSTEPVTGWPQPVPPSETEKVVPPAPPAPPAPAAPGPPAAAEPVGPPAAQPYSPPPSPPPPAAPPAPPSLSRGKELAGGPSSRPKWLIPAMVGGLAFLIIILLVLVFVVFKSAGPEATVTDFMNAVGKKDSATYMKLTDTSWFKGDSAKQKVYEQGVVEGLPPGGTTFSALVFETKESSGDKATVKLTNANLDYTENGQKKTESLASTGKARTFIMVKKDGKWLVSPASFGRIWAKDDKAKADAVLTGSYSQKSNDVTATFNNLLALLNTVPLPGSAQFSAQLTALDPQLAAFKEEAAKAKAVFRQILELQGENLAPYKDYAKAAIGLIDTTVQKLDLGKEMYGYITDVIAKSEAGQPPDQTAFNNKIDDYNKRMTALNSKWDDYKKAMQEAEGKING